MSYDWAGRYCGILLSEMYMLSTGDCPSGEGEEEERGKNGWKEDGKREKGRRQRSWRRAGNSRRKRGKRRKDKAETDLRVSRYARHRA